MVVTPGEIVPLVFGKPLADEEVRRLLDEMSAVPDESKALVRENLGTDNSLLWYKTVATVSTGCPVPADTLIAIFNPFGGLQLADVGYLTEKPGIIRYTSVRWSDIQNGEKVE